jgi:3-oxoacyl-[acyl-carrier-protein] synthase II
MSHREEQRVVVTGLGIVSSCGTGTEKTWGALVEGRSGIGPITLFDPSRLTSRIAGQVNDFHPEEYVDGREQKRMDRHQMFAVAAAQMAVTQARLQATPTSAERIAVIVGSSIGGIATLEAAAKRVLERGPDRLSALTILQLLPNMAAGYISARFGFTGPSWATNSACSTGAHAIGEGMYLLRSGRADAVVVGGTEAPITELGVGGFAAMKALSTRNDDPLRASRPFDRDRDGFVIGEGAGILVIETLEHATRRGAPILAEMLGYGASADASHQPTSPLPAHEGAQRSMRAALKDAGLQPQDVDYINAHGTSTPLGDRLELEGIRAVFGSHAPRLAISSTKSMTGHMNGAAGSAEAAFCVLALGHGVIPPTLNLEHPAPDLGLDLVPKIARRADLRVAMSNSFGFGGTNVSLVLKKVE